MAGSASRKTVLVADDSPFFRSMLAYALDEDGYRSLAAGSGEEVLDLARRELPDIDLFVLDLVMPGLNGMQLVERLRGTPGAERTPILIFTQFGVNPLERGILRRLGVERVVPKTVSIERLLWEVREAVFPGAAEKRAAPRVPASLPVTVRSPRSTLIAQTFNLSEQGMFLALPEGDAPSPGSEVDLRFWVPDAGEVLESKARVVWVNPAGPGVQRSHPPGFGVIFVAPPARLREEVGRYLKGMASDAAPHS